MSFDVETFRREKIRRLEARVAWLEQYRDELEELAAGLCELSAPTIGADPRDVLAGALAYLDAHRDARLELAAEIVEELQRIEFDAVDAA